MKRLCFGELQVLFSVVFEEKAVTFSQLTALLPTHERSVDITSWQPEDVEDWLNRNNLQHLKERLVP